MPVNPMLKPALSFIALLLVGTAGHAADNCEELRAKIEAGIAAKGVSVFSVTVVEAGAPVAGQVVGSCGQGTKQIVYAKGSATARAVSSGSPPAVRASGPGRPARDDDILTECKDGTVSVGGNCKP